MMKLELFSDHIATQRFLAWVILPISNKLVVLSLMLARYYVLVLNYAVAVSVDSDGDGYQLCWIKQMLKV